ncbi:UPF0262 family protein [Labrys wisconsinensis]|uniref:UPF0262 protein QO011_005708 n=1 Tax=Labrys wisconsinensis TaxID=425677 RepID=A0ABU0JGZ1_9HYPH|nr:UPF0262 family protein [Labrys wisconsinensis]MDQ0472678.1 uncharacterized protein (UPF0262 family) [Labrys wisconsinensis]
MSAGPPQRRLVAVHFDERSIGRGTPDQEHERGVAVYDLLEENEFCPEGYDGGPYALSLSLQEGRLVFDIRTEAGESVVVHILSLTPFRRVVRDYFMICESYYAAIRNASPSQIETIDMARRGLHNDGSDLLRERLAGKIALDFPTARRLFTLISVLHWKG